MALHRYNRGKVKPLGEVIRSNIKKGMTIHLGESANAAAREIIRQFWGSSPEFTVITGGLRNFGTDFIHCGLVKKLIMASCSETYPSQGPYLPMQRAYKQGLVEVENWSLLSIAQMLMAGASGLPFMPTKSIAGSSMAVENREHFLEIDDPFGSGRKISLVKAQNPDIAIIAGWAADESGNTITGVIPYSMGHAELGALASKNGAIVTVEELWPPERIQRYSTSVKIPGYLVNSVSVVPYGTHPQWIALKGCGPFKGYSADYAWMEAHRTATREPHVLDAFLKEWILDCPTQEAYLNKLGKAKLETLKVKRLSPEDRRKHHLMPDDSVVRSAGYNATEMMVVTAARKIQRIIQDRGYKVILAGIGLSGLPAWLSYYHLKETGYQVELLTGTGFYGYTPEAGDPQLANISNIASCKMIADVFHAYAFMVGGSTSRSISVLGAGQIDKFGNINSTRTADTYLVGSGGANDAAVASESLVVCHQSKNRFLSELPYITSSGNRVKTLVSDMGIFEKPGEDPEFTLTHIFPSRDSSLPLIIERIKERCGWELRISPQVSTVPEPYPDDLKMLRLFDPRGQVIKG